MNGREDELVKEISISSVEPHHDWLEQQYHDHIPGLS